MLMDLETLAWDDELLSFFGIPRAHAAPHRSSSHPDGYGEVVGPAVGRGRPAHRRPGRPAGANRGAGVLRAGEAKNTYGTATSCCSTRARSFVRTHNGLLTTVCYASATKKPVYATRGF